MLRAAFRVNHAGQRTRQHRPQHLRHQRKPVALVRTHLARSPQRQVPVFASPAHIRLLHDRRTVRLRNPARQQARANPARQSQLVPGNIGCRCIKQERRFGRGRCGNRNRIGAKPPNRAECRHNLRAACGCHKADHILFRRQHRVVTDAARMSCVEHRDHAHAHIARLVNRHLHRLRPQNDRKPLVRIHHRSRGRLADDPPVRLRIQTALVVLLHIGAKHIGHAVRLHTAQVGHRQRIRADRSVLFAHTHLLEHRRHGLPQRVFRHPHLVFSRYFESFKHCLLSFQHT